MYSTLNLKTVAECRTVLERARARGLKEVYDAVFRRLCELVGGEYDDPDDPLVRDFYETLAAYEQLLTEKWTNHLRYENPAEDRKQRRASIAD